MEVVIAPMPDIGEKRQNGVESRIWYTNGVESPAGGSDSTTGWNWVEVVVPPATGSKLGGNTHLA